MEDKFLEIVSGKIVNVDSWFNRCSKEDQQKVLDIILKETSFASQFKEIKQLPTAKVELRNFYTTARRIKLGYITYLRSENALIDLEEGLDQKVKQLEALLNQQYERILLALEEDLSMADVLTFDAKTNILTDIDKSQLALLLKQYYEGTIDEKNKKYLFAFTCRKGSDASLEDKLDKYFKMVQKFYDFKKQIAVIKRMEKQTRLENAINISPMVNKSRFTKALVSDNRDDREIKKLKDSFDEISEELGFTQKIQ